MTLDTKGAIFDHFNIFLTVIQKMRHEFIAIGTLECLNDSIVSQKSDLARHCTLGWHFVLTFSDSFRLYIGNVYSLVF